MSIFPPNPWGKRLGTYETVLRGRYASALASAIEHLTAAKAPLDDAIGGVSRALEERGVTTEKGSLEAAKTLLTAAKHAAGASEAALSAAEQVAAEQAAALVRSSLDLQVGKSGGLLTFNGLAVAVATILWTNTDLPGAYALPIVLFGALFLSSLLSLFSILIWWERVDAFKTAAMELKYLLRFTAARAWAINLAVILSLLSVICIAAWLSIATPKGSNSAPHNTRTLNSKPS